MCGGGTAASHQALLPKNCSSCARKDGLISNLFEKVNLYESAILGTTDSCLEVKHWDLDTILRNVGELNKLVAENERSVEYNDNGAKFLPTNTLQLAFYADGIQLDDGRFRPYGEKATRAFMKDLADGFFPSELQVRPSSIYGTFDRGIFGDNFAIYIPAASPSWLQNAK